MKNLTQLKEQLFETGYCSFNIKDMNEELYNTLSDKLGDGAHTLNHHIRYIRAKWLQPLGTENDWKTILDFAPNTKHHFNVTSPAPSDDTKHLIETTIEYENHEDGVRYCENLESNELNEFQQLWMFGQPKAPIEIKKEIHSIFSEIVDKFYNKEVKNDKITYEFTWYRKDGIIYSHTDTAQGGDVMPDPVMECSILLYLNKNYDKSHRGEFIADYGKYVLYPEFGNIALVDYNHRAIEHRVEPPTHEYGRYGILSFLQRNFVVSKNNLI